MLVDKFDTSLMCSLGHMSCFPCVAAGVQPHPICSAHCNGFKFKCAECGTWSCVSKTQELAMLCGRHSVALDRLHKQRILRDDFEKPRICTCRDPASDVDTLSTDDSEDEEAAAAAQTEAHRVEWTNDDAVVQLPRICHVDFGTKRVRKAPKLPDFELAEPTRTPIRKKPRPKTPHGKKKKNQMATAPDEELAQAVEGAFAYDEVMRDLASHFDGAVQPGDSEDLLGHEDSALLLPQFDPDCAPRTMGPWSPTEDEKLVALVRQVGAKNWPSIARSMAGRTNKQCRERWHNHLNPHLSRDAWTIEEDLVIHRGVSELGHKWSDIAARLRGRTDSSVKNRYNGRLKSMSDAAIRKVALCDTPTTELMHELVRRNALAEEERKPGRFSIGQIEALVCRDGEACNTSGCRWSNDEHSRLANAIPDGVPVNKIDWFAASRAVPTRTTVACRRHWEAYQRGGWKPTPFKHKEPEPEPTFGEDVEDVEAAVETLETHCALVAQHANDPKQLTLMALETYDEGSYGPTWSRSSVLVVGKPGLNFEFAAYGKTTPPPPPQTDVIARPVSSPTKLETVERWEWVTKKSVCSAWAPPMGQWQREQEEEEGEAARSEAPAPHTPCTPCTPWHRRSKRPAWQYYRQKKPRCTDVANPTKASDEECHVLATGALEKTVFV